MVAVHTAVMAGAESTGSDEDVAAPTQGSVAPQVTADRIVVGVDGSALSVAALRWALDEASLRHVGVHVVLAWAMPPVMGMAPVLSPSEVDFHAAAEAQLDAILSEQDVTAEGRPGDSPLTREVVERSPARGLLAAADAGASLLVVGSRGHGGFAGLLLGSVSQQCVAHAHCPVVVVHS